MRTCAIVTLAALAAGCGYTSQWMHPTNQPVHLQAAPDSGVVVFVRPSGYANGVGVTIIDEQGRFVGDAVAESNFAVSAAPGRHLFISWAENTDAVQVDVAPGKIYFIEVGMAPGFFSASSYLHGITQRVNSWPKKDQWMRDTTPMAADNAAGQQYLAGRSGDVAERVRRGNECYSKYKPEDQDKHTIRAEDGI